MYHCYAHSLYTSRWYSTEASILLAGVYLKVGILPSSIAYADTHSHVLKYTEVEDTTTHGMAIGISSYYTCILTNP